MYYCKKCGAALTPEKRFCSQCGTPVEEISRGCSSVAHMIRLPTADAAAPMAGAHTALSPTPTRIVTAGVTRISTLVSLLTSLPTSAATIAIR